MVFGLDGFFGISGWNVKPLGAPDYILGAMVLTALSLTSQPEAMFLTSPNSKPASLEKKVDVTPLVNPNM